MAASMPPEAVEGLIEERDGKIGDVASHENGLPGVGKGRAEGGAHPLPEIMSHLWQARDSLPSSRSLTGAGLRKEEDAVVGKPARLARERLSATTPGRGLPRPGALPPFC